MWPSAGRFLERCFRYGLCRRAPAVLSLRPPKRGTSGPPRPTMAWFFFVRSFSRVEEQQGFKKWCGRVSCLFIYSLVGRRALMMLPVTTLVGQSVEGSWLTPRYSTASAGLEPGPMRYQSST